MGKKFKFKLEGLLKLREFREHKVKIELGAINKKIQEIKVEMAQCRRDISECFEAQNELAESKVKARMLQFFPYFYKGKLDHIEALENMLYGLNLQYEQKLREMNTVHGERKVISNIKEKEFEKFKKQKNKEEEQDIQDLLQLRELHRRSQEG